MANLWATLPYWRPAYQDISRDGLGGELAALTAPGDRVVIVDQDWSPHLLYYADRRGLMLAHELESPEVVEVAHRRGYEYFFALDSVGHSVELAREWPWIGVKGRALYRVGDRPTEVVPATMLGTSDVSAFDEVAAQAPVLVGEPVTLTCGQPFTLQRGPLATWIHMGGERTSAGRILSTDGNAALPDVGVVVVPTVDPSAPLTLTCAGVTSMTIDGVVAGPPPEALG